MRCKGFLAAAASSGVIRTSPLRLVKHCSIPCRPFIAIHGQKAQLLQLALSPAVGAAKKRLCGERFCISCKMPKSVATIKVSASISYVDCNSLLVEPTTSASATTLSGDSGCTNTLAFGYSSFNCSSSVALNSLCTRHEPCQSSISAPVS